MSILLTKPLKFECTHCDKIYLHNLEHEQPKYPHCPNCQHAGLLLGVAETEDLVRHPVEFATSYVKQTWHMLSKAY